MKFLVLEGIRTSQHQELLARARPSTQLSRNSRKMKRGGQGGRDGPLAGSRDSVPIRARGHRSRRKIGVSGYFEAKYGLF